MSFIVSLAHSDVCMELPHGDVHTINYINTSGRFRIQQFKSSLYLYLKVFEDKMRKGGGNKFFQAFGYMYIHYIFDIIYVLKYLQ